MAIKFANLASTTLASGITSSATSLTVASASGFPTLGAGDYCYVTIGDGVTLEIVKVTAISGTTFTIVRAQDGTTASAFSSGEVVALRVVAAALDDLATAADTESVSKTGDTMTGNLTVPQINLNSASYDNRQIGMDSNGFFIYNAADSRYDLKISDSGVVTFAGDVSFAKGTRSLDLTLADSPATGDVGVQFRAGSGDFIGLAGGGSSTGIGLVVDSSNRVGIRTSSPRYELSVAGNNATAMGIAVDNANGSGTLDIAVLGSSYNSHQAGAGEVWFYSPDNINIGGATGNTNDIKFLSNNSVNMIVKGDTGNVGIGTVSPSSYYSKNLVVMADGDGTGGITIAAPATDDNSYLAFADGTSGAAAYAGYVGYSHSSESLFFGAGAQTALTLDSSQNANFAGQISATKAILTDDGASTPILQIIADDDNPWGLQIENSSASNDGLFQAYINNNNNVYFRARETGDYPTWYFQVSNGSNHHDALVLASTGITVGGSITSGSIEAAAGSSSIVAKSTNAANDALIAARWQGGNGFEMRYHPNSAVAYLQNDYNMSSGNVYGDIHIRQKTGGSYSTRMLFDNDAGKTAIYTPVDVAGTVQITNANPVFIINDNDATTATNQVGYISWQRQGVEKSWMGYGSSGNDRFAIQNVEGPLTIYPNVVISNTSPQLMFETGSSHYNWQIAAQESLDAAFEISYGSADANATDDSLTTVFTTTQGGTTTLSNNQDISMNANGAGQLVIKGNGYNGAIALDGTAMHIYHNSVSRDLILGVNEGEALRIHGSTRQVQLNNHATEALKIKSAGGQGYTQGSILIESGTTDSPQGRGQGVYMFNEGQDRTWYAGTLYTAGGTYGIGHASGSTFQASAASASNVVMSINSSNQTTFGGTVFINGTSDNQLFLNSNSTSANTGLFFRENGSDKWELYHRGSDKNLTIYSYVAGQITAAFHDDGRLELQGPSAAYSALRMGSTANTSYTHMMLTSNSGTGEIWKSGTGYTDFGGASALNIYNSNANIAFFPHGTTTARLNLGNGTSRFNGTVGIGVDPLTLLHIKGTGDAIRVESTNTGAGGAQMDLLHFTTSPADNDIHGSINFGGYYSGTTSAYGSAIRSVWSDVSARNGQLEFYTRDGSSFGRRLTINKSGNVGIGSNNPGSKLVIYEDDSSFGNTQLHIHNNKTDDAAVIRLEGKRTSSNDTAQVIFANNDSINSSIRNYSGGDSGELRFYTSESGTGDSVTERLSIKADGSVEIQKPIQANDGIRAWTDSGTKFYTHLATGSFYNTTGYIIVNTQIPGHNQSGNSNMFSFRVQGFWYGANEGGIIDFVVGCYSGENNFYNMSYVGSIPDAWSGAVAFYTDNNGKVALVLGSGSTAQKCEISVTDFTQGYGNVNTPYAQNWSTQVTTSLSGYTNGQTVAPRNRLEKLRGNTTVEGSLTTESSVTIGNDTTYGASGTGRYVTVGFGGRSNGSNRIFAHNTSQDGLYIASGSGQAVKIRTNGSGLDTFTFTSNGYFQVAGSNFVSPTRDVFGTKVAASSNLKLGDNHAVYRVGHLAVAGSSTGAILIQLPGSRSANYSMATFRITVYEYDSNAHNVYHVSGHDWTSGWYNTGATHDGFSTAEHVFLADNTTTNKQGIVIGSTSEGREYLTVTVDVISSPDFYKTAMDWTAGATVSLETSLTNWSLSGSRVRSSLRTQIGQKHYYDMGSDGRLYGGGSAYLRINSGAYATIQGAYGYVQLGAGNTSYAHFYTDRGRYYFNRHLVVDEGIFSSYDEDLILRRSQSSSYQMRLSTSGATFTHNVTAYSDERLKEDIKVIPSADALDTVKKLEGVTYRRIDNQEESIGFIAQQIERDCPEIADRVVGEMDDERKTKHVNYANMVALLTSAIQEQQKTIDALTKRIEDLENGTNKKHDD